MLYLLSTSVLAPGKMADWEEIVAEKMLPVLARLGIKLVASWRGYDGNVNVNYALYVYNDLADYLEMIALRHKDPDYKRLSARLNALQISKTSTILEPNTWSPMK